MPTITLADLRRRTRLDLVSDRYAFYLNDRLGGYESARDGQRRNERSYPGHRSIRLAAVRHFLRRGLTVYPQGVGVDGIRTCLDFAILRRSQILFVECLTPFWMDRSSVTRKRRILECAPLIFVLE